MSKILKGVLLLTVLIIVAWVFMPYQFSSAVSQIDFIWGEIAKHPKWALVVPIIIGIIFALVLWRFPYQKPEEITLPTIDSVIEKSKKESFDGFLQRGEDPYWVDFEKKYITERKEVDEIISKLEKDPLQLIIGHPASGKSFIAKNIGFKLREKIRFFRYDVFIIKIDRKRGLRTADIKEILKINKKRTLLIIDDIHSDFEGCDDILYKIGEKPKFKILLCGRSEVIKRKIESHTGSKLGKLMRDEKTCTKIYAYTAVEDIFKNFEDKCSIKIEEEHRVDLKKQYGQDLWILSRTLNFYKNNGHVPTRGELCDEINENLKKDHYKEIHTDDIILPISLFYRHEESIARRTLTEVLELNEGDIWKLINYGEIIETDGELSLHHSSRAKLYLETFKKHEKLGEKVKETTQKKFGDWYVGLYHLYFQSRPVVCIGALSWLSKKYKEDALKKDIICELLTDNETKNAIFETITESMVARNLNNFERVLGRVSNKTFSNEFLNYFSQDDLLDFLNNSKLNRIGCFLGRTGYYLVNFRNAYQKFSRNSFLLRKMNESTLDEIRVFVNEIGNVIKRDRSRGTNLVKDIEKLKEVSDLSQKLEDATIETISLLIKNIDESGADPKVIINRINSSFNLSQNKPPFNLSQKLEDTTIGIIRILSKNRVSLICHISLLN